MNFVGIKPIFFTAVRIIALSPYCTNIMIPQFLLLSILTLFLGVGFCYRMKVGCASDVSEEHACYIFKIKANTAEKVAGQVVPRSKNGEMAKCLPGSIAPFHRQVTANG